MRIARVLHESSPLPLAALERDGALYDAGELDRIFDTPFSPDVLAGASDFHTRVIALGGAGLDTLDERLCAGDRPSAARLLPGSFLWLAPCDTDRALYVQIDLHDAPPLEPSYRIANARGLLGHEATVPFPAGEVHPELGFGVAVVLRDDLYAAGADEAGRAILGYSILNEWRGRDQETRRPGTGSRDTPAQLGPSLVTADEVGDPRLLRARARVDGRVVVDGGVGAVTDRLAASIAWVSRWVELRAGDVIGVRCGHSATTHGSTAEIVIERLGKLVGRPAPGPAA